LLVGHSDTVWDEGTLDVMPVAFSDGRLHGPGSFDMKGGLVQMVFALEALRDLGLEPTVTPVPLINTDEEIGSPYSERQITQLARGADRALIIEPAASPGGALKTGRKGNGSYEATVTGIEAHAGLDPGSGASAIHAAAGVIDRLQALNDFERGTTVNVGNISGGTRPNVVPGVCRFSIDFRAVTLEDLQWLAAQIEGMAPTVEGTTIELVGGIERGPLERTPDNRRLWAAAQEAADALGFSLEEALVGGGSDGNLTSQYSPTLDGLGPVGGGAHARHEHVELDSLPQRTALLALLLLEPPLAS
jgi:glutamate carboxypeptidase